MSSFEVVVLGAGDTFSEQHHRTALLLICDGFHLAIDCPDMYRRVLRDAARSSGRALSIQDIDQILITHAHGDHMNGLEGFAFYKHFVEGKRLRLLTSPELRSCLWDQRLSASMGVLWTGQRFQQMTFDSYFQHVPLPWSEAISAGPFRIQTRRTLHHVPTTALLIEAAGRTLGYSADTAFDPALIEFLTQADLIIHETNLGPAHTPYPSLAALPAELRARMRLVHYPDTFDTATSNIAALGEGDVLRV
jgi:ribonuclease BN (tRNA processing enzyme)